MSSTGIFLPPRALQDSMAGGSTQDAFKATIQSAIMAAASASKSNAIVSFSGKTGADVHHVVTLLNQLGYKANLNGSNLEVSWA